MARAPFAAWRPISEPEPRITPRVVIYHTMAGTLQGTENYFKNGTAIESHFGVACPRCEAEGVAKDGAIWQWRDTNLQADANYKANDFAISVETCDHYKGGTYTNPGLSAAQIDSWIRIGNWAAETHNIPRRKCPAWNSSGFGYHTLFPGVWSNVAGKTCPNPTRINQFNSKVLPAIVAGVDPEEDDLMALFDNVAEFERAVERAVDHLMSQGLTGNRDGAIRGWAVQLDQTKTGVDTLLARPAVDPAAVAAAVVSAAPDLAQAVVAALVAQGVVVPAEIDYTKLQDAVNVAVRGISWNVQPV